MRVLLDIVTRNIILFEQFQHIVGETFNTHWTIEIHLEVEFVLEIGRPK